MRKGCVLWLETMLMRPATVNQNIKIVGQQRTRAMSKKKIENKDIQMLRTSQRGTAELGDTVTLIGFITTGNNCDTCSQVIFTHSTQGNSYVKRYVRHS